MMTSAWIHNSFTEIILDASVGDSTVSSRLSRRTVLANGIDVILSVLTHSNQREISVRLESNPTTVSFPHWQGVGITIQQITEYGEPNAFYLSMLQKENTNSNIFENVTVDIFEQIQTLSKVAESFQCLQLVLNKWKVFFEKEANSVLSLEAMTGLYGELLFLKELVTHKEASSILWWAGCENEQHDFYVNGNAVEVKTTTHKAPYSITIHSEYQLDPSEIEKALFLRVYALRLSKSEGQTLVGLAHDISDMLYEAPLYQQLFWEKMEHAGYRINNEKNYLLYGFKLRDSITYAITSAFPSIRKGQCPNGVGNVQYTLNTDACSAFIYTPDLFELIGGE